MDLLPGYKLVKLTDTEIVQEKKMGKTGIIRMFGNPNPDPEKTQKIIDNVYDILYNAYLRSESEKVDVT